MEIILWLILALAAASTTPQTPDPKPSTPPPGPQIPGGTKPVPMPQQS